MHEKHTPCVVDNIDIVTTAPTWAKDKLKLLSPIPDTYLETISEIMEQRGYVVYDDLNNWHTGDDTGAQWVFMRPHNMFHLVNISWEEDHKQFSKITIYAK